MRSTTVLSVLLPLASATFHPSNSFVNSGGAYPPETTVNGAFIRGNLHPNATNWVYFNGITWRANISEIPVSDATNLPPNQTSIDNAHIINTVLSLSWENTTDNFGAVRQERGVVAPYGCVMMIDTSTLPRNVTDRYKASDSGTCTSVFSQECYEDFLAAIVYDGINCPSVPHPVPASCASTLGAGRRGLSAMVENLENTNGRANSTIGNGEGFALISSGAYSGSNATALQEAEERLQVLVFKGLNVITCMRFANTTGASTTPSGSPTSSGSSPVATTTKAASSTGVVWNPVLGLETLSAVLLGL